MTSKSTHAKWTRVFGRRSRWLIAGLAAILSVAGFAWARQVSEAVSVRVAADPPALPPPNAVVGVGSDTTEGLFDQLSVDYNKNAHHPAPLYSWWSTGSPSIRTKVGCRPMDRPNGSSPGIAALKARQFRPDGRPCIDFARSLAPRGPGDPPSLVYVPFARDALAWAANAKTNAPSSLSPSQLKDILECTATTWDQVGGESTDTIQPFLPVTGPGLAGFLYRLAGIIHVGPCVRQTQQDQGTAGPIADNPNALVFYSVAKYLSQTEYHHNDVHGTLHLGRIGGLSPTVLRPDNGRIEINIGQVHGVPPFPAIFGIDEYIVVPVGANGSLPNGITQLFVGPRSWLCSNQMAQHDLVQYGFLALPAEQCGNRQ